MSDERDIDDILKSLDQMLREGSSHNDDHPESETGRHTIADLESGLAAVDEMALAERHDEVGTDSEQVAEAGEDDDRLPEAKSQPEIPHFISESENDDAEEDEPSVSSSSVITQKVILTEEMLVENPQGRLPLFAVGPKAAPSAVEQKAAPGSPKHASLRLDHVRMEQLLKQVADDVAGQLQQAMPALIRASINRHLRELKQGERPSETKIADEPKDRTDHE